jgi:pimeloyl-ACP methyl ester carboxylesterase
VSAEHDVSTRDGRTLRVRETGDPGGVPMLTLHGNPGAGIVSPADVARAADRSLRLIAYDRPGYGGSTRLAGRNVADCAGDVRAIADALGVRRLVVWGLSGGGPHAIACAALLDGLVAAVASLAAVAPHGAPKLDYFAGMSEGNVATVTRMLSEPAGARAELDAARDAIVSGGVDEMLAGIRGAVTEGDRAVLDAQADTLRERWLTGLAPGADGWWDDMLATVRDWGFGLTQTRTPVLVVHGERDTIVPVAHGRWLAEAIPSAEPHLLGDEGHFSLLGAPLDDVYDWLLARL